MEGEDLLHRSLLMGEVLARTSRQFPGRVALIEGERQITYGDYNRLVNRYANGLLALGIKPGEHVAVWMYNSIELTALMFAVTKAGATAVPLNFRYNARDAAYVIDQSDAVAVLAGAEFTEILREIRPELPKVLHFLLAEGSLGAGSLPLEELLQAPDDEPVHPVDMLAPAIILYTSGTTGQPKGAVLSHLAVVTNALTMPMVAGFRSGDVYLNAVPLFHVGFICFFLAHILVGGTVVIMRAFDPSGAAQAIERHKVTTVWFVPTMAISFLAQDGFSGYDFSSLRIWNSGGAILPTELRARIMRTFPNARINDVFGMTETASVTTLLPHEDGLRKSACVGLPIPTVEVRVVDEEDRDVPQGAPGEIVYRGPTIMTEYYKLPEATARAMRGGWFHAGDIVRQDEEGYVYVLDRKTDMIISGGENIFPREVEEVLFQHPAVLEAAVIGVADEHWGEAVKAIVALKPEHEASAEELMEFCAERLSRYKKPRSVEFVPSLPRNASGKVLKTALRKSFGAKAGY